MKLLNSDFERKERGRHRRRGSLYISVVLVGAIVSMLGMSALLVARINRQSHEVLADTATARLNAQAALRLGLLKIENDPDWRFNHTSSDWIIDQTLGDGTFSLEVTDPSDNDISDAAADPVILTGIGRKGDAIHKTQITLAPLYRGYNCLQSAIHAGDDVMFTDVTPICDGIATANDDIKAYNSVISFPVEGADVVTGDGFLGSTTEGAPAREMPVTDEVLDFYKANGTWINVNDLPTQYADIVRNGGMEIGTEFWTAIDSTIGVDSSTANSGTQSLAVTQRITKLSGVGQDITNTVLSGRTFEIEFSVYIEPGIEPFYVHIQLDDVNGKDDHIDGPFTPASSGTWQTFTASITPWFELPLTSATLVFNTSPHSEVLDLGGRPGPFLLPPADFKIDDVSMRATGSVRNMDKMLLSPEHNPFGETNPKGIYVIDMQGQKLAVRNSRIHGTLVLIDPSSSTELGDYTPLAMSPADPGLPSLLVSGQHITINPSTSGLVENSLQLNLNPLDAPYPALGSDDDMDDTFPSGITGMLYSTHMLRMYNTNIHGAIISGHDVDIRDNFSMTYDSRFYRNPPPGFSGPEQIRLLLGSAKRVTD